MSEYSLAPAPAVGSAGLVRFTVRNAGAINHEFVVLRTDKQAGSLLKGGEADERGNVGEIGDLPPGSAKTLALRLKAGHYALICNLPGHYAAGQHSDFTVRRATGASVVASHRARAACGGACDPDCPSAVP